MTGSSPTLAHVPGVSTLIIRQCLNIGEAYHLDMGRLLKELNLQEEVLSQPDGWLSAADTERMLRLALSHIRNPLTGLDAAPHINLATLGVLGYVSQTSSTLQDLIINTQRFERLLSDVGTTSLQQHPGASHWQWVCSLQDPLVSRHVTECVIGCWSVMLKLMQPMKAPALLAVHFSHALPDAALHGRYMRFFGCPVHFGQASNALILSPLALQQPLLLANPNVHRALEEHALRLLEARRREANLVDCVSALLAQEIEQGQQPVRDRIAESLGMSARSLHRKLEESGHSFRGLLDTVRLEIARRSLQHSDTPVGMVAQQLGFQESQSFIRWFRRQVGTTPGEFRQQKSAGDASAP